MKIVRIYPNFQVDLKYTEHYLARELDKKGNYTTFISSDKYLDYIKKYIQQKDGAGYYKYKYYDLYRLKSILILDKSIIIEFKKLFNLLFKSNYDLFHLYGLATFTGLTTLWFHKLYKSKIPILISDHSDSRTHSRQGFFANLYYLFFKIQLKFLFKRIFKIITFSQTSADLLSKRFGIPKDKFEIIKLGYDHENYKFIKKFKNDSTKFVMGYAGKITKAKRIDYLIRTIDKLEIKKQVKLIVVGYNENDKYCKTLRELSEKVNFEIEFKPFATPEELIEFYNFIDLAVYPGGISITTIEASGCGTPVVIYESIAGLEERVNYDRGKLFKTKQELESCILEYYNQYEKNNIDNELIADKTREIYSWEKISNDYLELYKKAEYGK